MDGKCPGCDSKGTVGEPCSERACLKRDFRFIPEEHYESAHDNGERNPDPLIGQLIGDFLVVDLLGVGGFGKVYLVLQQPLFRLRGAMKVLEFPTRNQDFADALLEKFRREAEVLAEFSHPNIVRLLKYGIHRNQPFLVMEYVEGGRTLGSEIDRLARQQQGFTQEQLSHIFHQLLNGLEAAHERSIIHRDLKPENIMLQDVVGNPYHVRILDFGIAKFVENRADTKWPLGSPSYMAPEQVTLENLGTWTDMYALGVMVFEMVTGCRPFPGETDDEIMSRKLEADFDPFEQVEGLEIPDPTSDFMRRAIAADPDERLKTVDEFRTALDAGLEALVDKPKSIGPGGRSLTYLLDSNDLMEFEEASDATSKKTRDQSDNDSYPPDVPPDSDLSSEPADDAGDGDDGVPPDVPSDDADNPGEAEADADRGAGDRAPWREAAVLLFGVFLIGAFLARDSLTQFFDGAPAGPASPGEAAPPAYTRGDEQGVAPETATEGDTSRAPASTDTSTAADSNDAAADSDVFDAETTDDVDAGPPLPDHAATQVSAGKHHTCAVRLDGDVRCWGGNRFGQLGLGHTRRVGDNEPANHIEPLDFGAPVRQIAAAGDRDTSFNCLLTQGGEVRCWGDNTDGQLGYGHTSTMGNDETLADLPAVDLGGEAVEIAAGASKYGSHACAILQDRTLRCWGKAKFGKLGYGHTNVVGDNETPKMVGKVRVGSQVVAVGAGKYNTCVILADRSLRCWGWNKYGQLGLGHTRDIGDDEIPSAAEPVEVGGPVAEVSVGRRHICAVLQDQSMRCWGWNKFGQLGLGHTETIGDDKMPASAGPAGIEGEADRVATGPLHTSALPVDGRVRCWGDNRFGQLGYGHERALGAKSAPAKTGTVYLGEKATDIAAGRFHTCAILESGALRCWGLNARGQLGLGHTDDVGDDEPAGSVRPVPIE